MSYSIPTSQKAWIVFTGKADLRWLKILKPGFRHCFAIINDGHKWLSIDPLSNFMDVQIYHHIDAEYDLPAWLKDHGYKVIAADIDKSQSKPAPLMIMSCVETIKRLLGIRDRLIFTPWQLYRHLQNQHFKSYSSY